jgi:16S rRNA (guanine(527)-N(7))-methyltransferase GidB
LALTKEELEKPGFDIVDIGAGAGFPGVPLKIVFPTPKLVLIESTAKKTVFLQHIIQRLESKDVEIVARRAEEVAHSPLYREQFALVVSRAVASLPTLVELALPFCQVGGRFVAQKKGKFGQEINKANNALTALGGKLDQIKKIELEEFGDERCLVIFDKIYYTPDEYPRRSGIPQRRPL